jgi:serpin B
MRTHLTLGLGLLLGALPACGEGNSEPAGTAEETSSAGDAESGETEGGEEQWDEVRSQMPHDANPMPSEDDQAALADGQRAFSLELYRQLRQDTPGNFAISGLSVHLAFGMLYAGAVDTTRQELIDNMHFLPGETAQHEALNWQSDELVSRNLEAIEEEFNMYDPVVVAPANQMWVQDGNQDSILAPFLDKLSVHYDTGMYLADFAAQPEEERMAINQWVADRTNDLIEELLPGGSILPAGGTTSVIVNALYLKAPWAAEFPEFATQLEDFTLADASTKQVQMMHNAALGGMYTETVGYRALGMPLRGNHLELVAILPDGDLDTFVDGLTGESLGAIFDEMLYDDIETYLPRFSTENKFNLNAALMALGMPSMFSGGLDDIGGGIMQVSDVFHDTVVVVDEKGVEAAAATAIVTDTSGTGEPFPSGVFRADRPFMFAIYDRTTRTVMFLGQVTDPEG